MDWMSLLFMILKCSHVLLLRSEVCTLKSLPGVSLLAMLNRNLVPFFLCFVNLCNCLNPLCLYPNHWHVFTWIWEMYLAWYQQAIITGREMGADRSLSYWIIELAVYLQPIKMLILSTELFSLSHRPTLITKSFMFWKIWNLSHEKCSSSRLEPTAFVAMLSAHRTFHCATVDGDVSKNWLALIAM